MRGICQALTVVLLVLLHLSELALLLPPDARIGTVRGPWAPMHAVFRPKYLARCVRAASLRGGFSSTAVC